MSRKYHEAFKQGYKDGFKEGFSEAIDEVDSDQYHRANHEGYEEGFEQGTAFASEELIKVLQELVIRKDISLEKFSTIKNAVASRFRELKEEEMEYSKLSNS